MTVKERVIKFAKSQEKSVRAFEINCGLTVGYVNAIRVSIQPDKMQRIASHYPNLNTGWLMTGEGPMLRSGAAQEHDPAGQCTGTDVLLREQITTLHDYIACLKSEIDTKNHQLAANNQQMKLMAVALEALSKKVADSGNGSYAAGAAAQE